MQGFSILKKIAFPVILICLFACPLNGLAGGDDDEIEALSRKIDQLERQRQRDMDEFKRMLEERDQQSRAEIRALKQKMKELEKTIESPKMEAEPRKGMAMVKEKAPSIADRVDFYGDFRLRSEVDANRSDSDDPRFRSRIRLRLGANVDIFEDQLSVGARVRTGNSDDPRSPHITFGDGFESAEASFDRAFVKYRPSFIPGLTLVGGKANLPVVRQSIFNELIWDQDVQPEGFSAVYSTKGSGKLDKITFVLGQYVIEQQGEEMSWVTIPQVAFQGTVDQDWKAKMAAGWYLYYGNNLTPNGSTDLVRSPKNAGNATVDTDGDGQPDEFASDFRILSFLLDLEYGGFYRPVVLTGEYFHNFGADNNRDQGFSVGAQLGKASKPRDWKLYYQFQIVEQDSIFTPFSQDDFLLATNFVGHVAGFKYKLTKRVDLHLWTLMAQRDDTFGSLTDENRIRTRLDLNVKF